MSTGDTNIGANISIYDLFETVVKQHLYDMSFTSGVYIPTAPVDEVRECTVCCFEGSPRKTVVFEFIDGHMFYVYFPKEHPLFDSINQICEQVNEQLQIYKMVAI